MESFAAHAAIFDMDGVLVDSIALHERAWGLLGQHLNKPFSRDLFLKSNGFPTLAIIMRIFGWTDDAAEAMALADQKEALYLQMVKEEGIAPLHGVVTFLKELHAHGVPCAVGTSAPRSNLRIILHAAGIEAYFQATSTVEDVKEGKPAPDIFLKASELLGIPPAHCVVFEDAPAGIIAAKAAEMKVVAIASTHPRHELQEADIIVDSFQELSCAQLFAFA